MYYKFLEGTKAPISTVFNDVGLLDTSFSYNINEVNICEDFNKDILHGNGFYFTDEVNILNFLGYGQMLYEVELPDDAIIIEINDICKEFKTDKIILKNPCQITNNIVKDFLSNGSIVVDDKIVDVLYELNRKNEKDIFSTIFNLIDENNADIASKIFYMDFLDNHFDEFVNKYSKTTNPYIINEIYNQHQYKKQYEHNSFSAEKYILNNISKNLNKPIKLIIENIRNNIEQER